MTIILSNEDIRPLVGMTEYMEALESAFADLADGKAITRPRSHTYSPIDEEKHYMFKTMDGSIPRYGVQALRLTSDVVREHVQDGKLRREKIPAAGGKWVGLVLLFSIHTGEPLAIMQDGYLQRMRVGATSGIAAKHMSRPDTRRIGMYGTGWQAGAQLMALKEVRDIEDIKVYSTRPEHRERFAGEMRTELGLPIRAVDSPHEAAEGVDMIVCATNSLDPVFQGEWLRPGMHVNSINGGELDAETIRRSEVIGVRSRVISSHWAVPGLQPKQMTKGVVFKEEDNEKIQELGEIVLGRAPGRTSAEQITLFGGSGTGGSSGLGIQFAAVAYRIYENAKRLGAGRHVPTDWFLEDVHP